jgi:hypothetical protein
VKAELLQAEINQHPLETVELVEQHLQATAATAEALTMMVVS